MSPKFPDVSVDCPLLLEDLVSLSGSPISPDLAEWKNYRWKEMQPVKLQKFLDIYRLTINYKEVNQSQSIIRELSLQTQTQ